MASVIHYGHSAVGRLPSNLSTTNQSAQSKRSHYLNYLVSVYFKVNMCKQTDSQPKLTVRIKSYPESNGKRNWTALLLRVDKFDGLIGTGGGVVLASGELWNRVAYAAERARFLLGERDDEPWILDYGDDIHTPEEWAGEQKKGRFNAKRDEAGSAG